MSTPDNMPMTTELEPLPREPSETSEAIAQDYEAEMTFIEHLDELRRALIICLLALILGAVVGFYFHQWFLDTLNAQLPGVKFVILSPEEGFMAVLRLSIMMGLFFSIPVILREIFWFIGPAFSKRQQMLLMPITLVSYALFVGGVMFAYQVLLPIGARFLIGFTPAGIEPTISLGRYIGFSATLIFTTGLVFQLPILLLMLSMVGIVSRKYLAEQRRYMYFGSFVISALITPSVDIFTQTLLASTLILLYELGLVLMAVTERLRSSSS